MNETAKRKDLMRNEKICGKLNNYTISTLCNTSGIFSYDVHRSNNRMRMMHDFFPIEGVVADIPHGWIDKSLEFYDYFLIRVVEYQKQWNEGIGIVIGNEVINWGLSKPMLRASRIQWDLRKVETFECYEKFDWDVQ
ncbi:hypothetical protein Ahy_A06g028394 [Arachis hypogaea]|uniref:NADH-quinone oxidoreductase subunit D domain-containing protein n=1 Tax=Arachis hypogaea TaxID=3818 RepID=A0A445CQZ9_ARAHY|nr:hypothetical protein Ahy_A06g028394 [Arachis hypogaea]